jgi:hypothetical protein
VKRLGWQCVTCTCADNFVQKSFISCDSLYAIDLTKSVEIERDEFWVPGHSFSSRPDYCFALFL